MSGLLRVSGIEKRFGGVDVLRGIGLGASPGAITALIGPNGAGKSTLANIVSGFVAPEAGSVQLDGTDITRWPSHRRAALGIGRTFQNLQVFTGMTVLENVTMGSYTSGRAGVVRSLFRIPPTRADERDARERAMAVLEDLGIAHLAERKVENLGFGEAKLVEPARVLAMGPKVVVMDEPAAGLPPSGAAELAGRIAAIARSGIAVLLIEHNMKLVMDVSDHVVVLDHGVEIARGAPDEVRNDEAVIEAYLGPGDG